MGGPQQFFDGLDGIEVPFPFQQAGCEDCGFVVSLIAKKLQQRTAQFISVGIVHGRLLLKIENIR
jgi:hypothetical protein